MLLIILGQNAEILIISALWPLEVHACNEKVQLNLQEISAEIWLTIGTSFLFTHSFSCFFICSCKSSKVKPKCAACNFESLFIASNTEINIRNKINKRNFSASTYFIYWLNRLCVYKSFWSFTAIKINTVIYTLKNTKIHQFDWSRQTVLCIFSNSVRGIV